MTTPPFIKQKVAEFIKQFFVYDMTKNIPHGDHVGAQHTAGAFLTQALTDAYNEGRRDEKHLWLKARQIPTFKNALLDPLRAKTSELENKPPTS